MFFQTAVKARPERKSADGSAQRQKSVVIMTDNSPDDRKGGTDRKRSTDLSKQKETAEVTVKDTEEPGRRISSPVQARVTPKQDGSGIVTLPEIAAGKLLNTLRIEGRWVTCLQLGEISAAMGVTDVGLGYYVWNSTRRQFTQTAYAAAQTAVRTPGSLGKKLIALSTLAFAAGGTTVYTGICYRDESNEKRVVEELGHFKGIIGATIPKQEPVVDLDASQMKAKNYDVCRSVSKSIGTVTRKAAKVDYCWPATQQDHPALAIPMGTEVDIPLSKPRK